MSHFSAIYVFSSLSENHLRHISVSALVRGCARDSTGHPDAWTICATASNYESARATQLWNNKPGQQMVVISASDSARTMNSNLNLHQPPPTFSQNQPKFAAKPPSSSSRHKTQQLRLQCFADVTPAREQKYEQTKKTESKWEKAIESHFSIKRTKVCWRSWKLEKQLPCYDVRRDVGRTPTENKRKKRSLPVITGRVSTRSENKIQVEQQ